MKNTPNIITIVRIILAIIFPFSDVNYHGIIIITALASEFLDGFIARIFGWESKFGQVLDPIADKLFIFSVGLTWVSFKIITLSELSLLATREIGLILMIIKGKTDLIQRQKVHFFGKLTTVLQFISLYMVVLLGTPVFYVFILTSFIGALAAIHYLNVLTSPYWYENNKN